MKPVPFAYHAPDSLAEAIRLLATLDDARVLAGGQSLVPMLNLRAATPSHLIDLGRVAGLAGITETSTTLRIGAMTTQRALERSDLVRRQCPLLHAAVLHVGHQQTRNRGTIGGSLCHLDPGAELPVAAAALEATLTAESPRGARTLPFADFPAGYLSTTLAPDEILTAIDVPKARTGEGCAFLEFNRRPADFAVVSVAVMLALDGDGIRAARIAVGGIGAAPVRLGDAEAALAGRAADDATFAGAARFAAALPCEGDVVNPAEYRRGLAGVLVRRALAQAARHASGERDD